MAAVERGVGSGCLEVGSVGSGVGMRGEGWVRKKKKRKRKNDELCAMEAKVNGGELLRL